MFMICVMYDKCMYVCMCVYNIPKLGCASTHTHTATRTHVLQCILLYEVVF